MKPFEGKTVRLETAIVCAVATALAGMFLGSGVSNSMSTYQTANECVMDQLSDMKTDGAVSNLLTFCRWEYGDFDRG